MALPTPECAASELDQRGLLAVIYEALFTYAGNEGFDTDGLPAVDCILAADQREILVAIYDATYLLNNP